VRRLALALAALALAGAASGCETTAERSAKLEKAAKRVTLATQQGLTITHAGRNVKVTSTAIVRGSEGSAAVVTLRNSSPRAMRDVPISISLKDAHGTSVYTNGTPGLAKTLTSIALLPARGEGVWIDDQIPAASTARSITTKIGEGTPASGAPAKLAIRETHLEADPSGSATVEGTIRNPSSVAQSELVIYAVARKGGRIVAAGRAVLASLAAGASMPFQAFFIGAPNGAKLQLSAPPTTLG
jgi:hypothetical protein